MGAMTDVYLTWCNESNSTHVPQPTTPPSEPSTSTTSRPTSPMTGVLEIILLIDLYTLADFVDIYQNNDSSVAVALVYVGYLGNSPIHPSLAISIKTLELFRVICLHCPSFSVEAFAKTLSYLYRIHITLLSTPYLSDFVVRCLISANTGTHFLMHLMFI